jgi:hypothetical protein
MEELPAAKNSVTINREGYIMVKLTGPQTYLTMEGVAKLCRGIADDWHARDKPVLALVDFTEDEAFNTGTNKAVLEALEDIKYDKVALYGNPKLHDVTSTVLQALGKSAGTKLFDTREEALTWLQMKDPLES